MPEPRTQTASGLDRLSRTTRWALAASVAATAVVFGVAARSSSPASDAGATRASGDTTAPTSVPAGASIAAGDLPPILPPVQPIVAASGGGGSSVTSGGS